MELEGFDYLAKNASAMTVSTAVDRYERKYKSVSAKQVGVGTVYLHIRTNLNVYI